MFTSADFELFQQRFQSDPEWNGRRLEVRHRLQALGNCVKEAYGDLGVGLDRRESLHHPHSINRKRVRRQRTMLFRDKKSRSDLQRFLGKELGKDLDSAVRNAHFQIALDDEQLWWGIRLDDGAWYDLNYLLKLAEEEPGRAEITQACAAAPNFQLEVDGGGARSLPEMNSRDWRDLAGILEPGRSALEIVRRMSAAEAIALGEDLDELILADLLRLAPLYRLSCWTLESLKKPETK